MMTDITGNAFPKVSVIVPVYHVEKYLRRCLDSVMNQTLKDLEIILVFDGTVDEYKICEEYTGKDTRFSIIRQNENKGLGAARNLGIKKSRGRYIAFVDADDYIDANMYISMVSVIEENNTDLVICGAIVEYEKKASLKARISDREYYKIKFTGLAKTDNYMPWYTPIAVWSHLYKKDIIERYNITFPEGLLNEDASFVWQYLMVSNYLFFLNDVYYHYIRRENSLMDMVFLKKMGIRVMDHIVISELLYNFMIRHGIYEKRKEMFLACYLISVKYSLSNSPRNLKNIIICRIKRFAREKKFDRLWISEIYAIMDTYRYWFYTSVKLDKRRCYFLLFSGIPRIGWFKLSIRNKEFCISIGRYCEQELRGK
jgi:glycosyltransferase involved in cell wall biosynthesis